MASTVLFNSLNMWGIGIKLDYIMSWRGGGGGGGGPQNLQFLFGLKIFKKKKNLGGKNEVITVSVMYIITLLCANIWIN